MDDLISRQQAIDAINTWFELYALSRTMTNTMSIQDMIRALPSAQPERKKGKWISNDNGTYSCSVCQSWIPEQQHCYARYCLYCGADMRGENDEML